MLSYSWATYARTLGQWSLHPAACMDGWCVLACPVLQTPLWRQRAGAARSPSGFVLWDYHVILLQHTPAPAPHAPAPHAQRGLHAARSLGHPDDAGQAGQAGSDGSCAELPGGSTCAWVWDLDTLLPFPCPLALYAAHALRWGVMEGAEGDAWLPPHNRRCGAFRGMHACWISRPATSL